MFAVKQAQVISEACRKLMVISAFLVCLSHGSNDVSNAISPLIVIMDLEALDHTYAYLLGSSGIAIGLAVLGYKVMQTIGKDIIVLDFMKGFAAQFSTALCVLLGSGLGMPLSTTHCMIGALAGIFISGKTKSMKYVYDREDSA